MTRPRGGSVGGHTCKQWRFGAPTRPGRGGATILQHCAVGGATAWATPDGAAAFEGPHRWRGLQLSRRRRALWGTGSRATPDAVGAAALRAAADAVAVRAATRPRRSPSPRLDMEGLRPALDDTGGRLNAQSLTAWRSTSKSPRQAWPGVQPCTTQADTRPLPGVQPSTTWPHRVSTAGLVGCPTLHNTQAATRPRRASNPDDVTRSGSGCEGDTCSSGGSGRHEASPGAQLSTARSPCVSRYPARIKPAT